MQKLTAFSIKTNEKHNGGDPKSTAKKLT